MNGKMIGYILCRLMGMEGVLLLLPMAVAILYGEETWTAFFCSCGGPDFGKPGSGA